MGQINPVTKEYDGGDPQLGWEQVPDRPTPQHQWINGVWEFDNELAKEAYNLEIDRQISNIEATRQPRALREWIVNNDDTLLREIEGEIVILRNKKM